MLRLKEVAKLLSVSKSTVQRWTNDGKIPCSKTLGGQARYRVEDIRALQKQMETFAKLLNN